MNDKFKHIAMVAAFLLILGGFGIAQFVLPDKALTASERRTLEQLPEFSAEKLQNGDYFTQFDEYLLDQFPLRDNFRTLKAMSEYYLFLKGDNNDIYISGGFVSQTEYPAKATAAADTAAKYTEIYEKLFDGNAKAYYSVIPDKNYFLAERSGQLSIDYDAFFADMIAQTDEKIGYIPITDLLVIDDYYKTDIHWRQECIVDVADRLLSAMGAEIPSRDYESLTLSPFYGGYYGQAALPVAPDTLTYLTNDALESCTVYNPVTGQMGGVYETESFGGMDSYDVFLSGAESLLVVENPANESGRVLYIVRDSFAGSLAPLLIESYSKIVLVDIRYISADAVLRYVTPEEDCDVLFILNTIIMNRSSLYK